MLVDSPSLQTVADAVVLSLIVDRLVVVVARGSARRETVDVALKELAGVHQVPLGIIVSHSEISSDFHYDRPADGNRGSTTPSEPSARPRQSAGPQLRVINPSQSGTTQRPSRPNQHSRLDSADGDTPDTDGIDGHGSHDSAVLRRIG